ncbi:MAG: Abi family protein [Bacilli bacterium]|jgi:hypothetical protein|nr:Abi family protein [Bacilli bacterium]
MNKDKDNIINWKKPLTLDEQIEYLRTTKNIIFSSISECDAKKKLYELNYINIITPFKYKFYNKDINNNPILNSNNKHQYYSITDFNSYLNLYKKEREYYPLIFKKISKFESTFSTILSYYTSIKYEIDSENNFNKFVVLLNNNADRLKNNDVFSKERIENIKKHIKNLKKYYCKYANIFVFLDNLSFGQLLSVYICIGKETKKIIFKELLKLDQVLFCKNIASFEKIVFKLIDIRNCVYHNNSIEITINYSNKKNRTLRDNDDKKDYIKILNYLTK